MNMYMNLDDAMYSILVAMSYDEWMYLLRSIARDGLFRCCDNDFYFIICWCNLKCDTLVVFLAKKAEPTSPKPCL